MRKVILTDTKRMSISFKFDIGLFKHKLLFYYFSVSRVWMIVTKDRVTPILIMFFSMFNDCRALTLPHTCDVTSLDWDEHNLSCCGTISLSIWSHMMCPRSIRDQELGRKSNGKIYRCVKGDIDRCEFIGV